MYAPAVRRRVILKRTAGVKEAERRAKVLFKRRKRRNPRRQRRGKIRQM
jgi:hypothetical protein